MGNVLEDSVCRCIGYAGENDTELKNHKYDGTESEEATKSKEIYKNFNDINETYSSKDTYNIYQNKMLNEKLSCNNIYNQNECMFEIKNDIETQIIDKQIFDKLNEFRFKPEDNFTNFNDNESILNIFKESIYIINENQIRPYMYKWSDRKYKCFVDGNLTSISMQYDIESIRYSVPFVNNQVSIEKIVVELFNNISIETCKKILIQDDNCFSNCVVLSEINTEISVINLIFCFLYRKDESVD